MAKISFMDHTWPELQECIQKNPLAILPVAQTEEHGPHLPIGCDTFIGSDIARIVSERLSESIPTLLMPAIWAGYSPKKMQRWAGTMRIRTRVVIDYVHDVLASLCEMGLKKIVIIDSHGQHKGILDVAIKEIADEYNVYCALTNPVVLAAEKYSKIRKTAVGGANHACEFETSLLIHLGYDIDMRKATDVDDLDFKTKYFEADAIGSKKYFISTWGIHDSKEGILGAPKKACKQTGKSILDAIVHNYVELCEEYYHIVTH